VQKRLDGLECQGSGPASHQPWESDQLEAIRDGVVAVDEAFQHGVPLELAIAELGAAKAEADVRCQCPISRDTQPIDPVRLGRPGLPVPKETTWEGLYKPRMALVLKTAKGPPAARDATQLLEAQADLWSQRPGCRTSDEGSRSRTSPAAARSPTAGWCCNHLPGLEGSAAALDLVRVQPPGPLPVAPPAPVHSGCSCVQKG
jgi:hypothetical protein